MQGTGQRPSTPAAAGTAVLRVLLVGIVLAGFALRLTALSEFGFGEDEVAKLLAIDEYRQGRFSANAEHPMLMKLLIWASLSSAEQWNHLAPSMPVAPESALRMPNVVAGTLTALVVYGVAALFFGAPAGVVAAAIVAFDPTVIAINRLGKEDTLLVFFFLIAVYCYERAKTIGHGDPDAAQPWYTAAGACFGLMLASKYMPHLFGLYALFNVAALWNAGRNRPRLPSYYGAMAAAFVAANFAVLLPSTWYYWLEYARGGYSSHHGYFYDGQLYVNSAKVLLEGVPWTYYLRLLSTKVPLLVLTGAVAGVVLLVRRRRERGYVWLRVFLVVQLLGYSVLASKFQRYVLPMLIVTQMLAATAFAAAAVELWGRARSSAARAACGGLAILALASLALTPLTVTPFYSTYQNTVGAALAAPLQTFPEEAYDYGVREAVARIVRDAGPGAIVASDATMVVGHYLQQSGRTDLRSVSLSQDGLSRTGEHWVIVQDSHVYFENESQVKQLRNHLSPVFVQELRGVPVVQVFRLVF